MKVARRIAIAIAVYILIVILFESLIGVIQPSSGGTLVIITADADGTESRRVVSRLESDGKLYVAANHWPRAWYQRAREQPDVRIEIDGEQSSHRAVAVEGAEHDRVDDDNSLPLPFRVLTGFPPRLFLRLDPS